MCAYDAVCERQRTPMGISFLPNHVQLKLGLLDLVASIFTTETPHLPRFLVISEKKPSL